MSDVGVEVRGQPHGGDAQFDLFVLYAAADGEWVRGYLLPELGIPAAVVITGEQFTPGVPVVQEFERAVASARFTVVVLSPAFLADQWSSFGELLATHSVVRDASDGLVPIVLEGCEVPLRLDFRVRLDCTDAARWDGEVARLRELLERPAPAAEELTGPYPGLVPFDAGSARFFFGRDSEAEQIRTALRHHRLLLVIGPSGCGKSSLVRAGVLPWLRRGSPDAWLIRRMVPGDRPLAALRAALDAGADDAEAASAAPVPPTGELVTATLGSSPPSTRLLLVVDQLEEVFTQSPDSERNGFLAALAALRHHDRCVVLLLLRADFYADFMGSDLWPLGPGQLFELGPLRGPALREAILRPAAEVGAQVEPVLLERLLHDAADEPGALPLLQETLALLWERRRRRLLTAASYAALSGDSAGGLAAAIATRADAVLAELTPAQRRIARRILLRLIQLGEGREDTRRRQPVSALQAVRDDPAVFAATLERLAANRLVTITAPEAGRLGAERQVDLAHEVLIKGWPTLRDWVSDGRADMRVRAQLAAHVRDWVDLGRVPDALYRGVRLAAAAQWADRDDTDLTRWESEFLDASRALATDELRRARLRIRRARQLAAALGLLLVVAAGATLLAVRATDRATRETGRAVAEARRSTSRVLAHQADDVADTNPDLSILLSLAAFNSADTGEARAALQAQIGRRDHVRRILTAAGAPVHTVGFSGDGTLLAAGGDDGAVTLWTAPGWTRRGRLTLPGGPVVALTLSRDGHLLAAASERTVRLWNLTDPTRPQVLPGPADGAHGLAFTPDGQLLLAATSSGVAGWDVVRGRPRSPIAARGDVHAVVATPDGRGVVAVDDRGATRWDIGHRTRQWTFAFKYPANPPYIDGRPQVALSRDGRRLAMSAGVGGVELWDVTRRRRLDSTSSSLTLALTPDGALVASTSGDSISLDQLDPANKSAFGGFQPRAPLDGQQGVTGLAFSPDGLMLASGGLDGRVFLWTIRSQNTRTLTDGGLAEVSAVQFNQTGSVLAASGRGVDTPVRLTFFDVGTGKRIGYLPDEDDAAFGPASSRLVATSGRYTPVALWDLGTKKMVGELRWTSHRAYTYGVEISPDGRWLAQTTQISVPAGHGVLNLEEQVLVLYDLRTRRVVRTWTIGPPANYGLDTDADVAFSPRGNTLVFARNNARRAEDPDIPTIMIWDVEHDRQLREIPVKSSDPPLAFSPDGNTLLAGYQHQIEFRQVPSGTLEGTLQTPQLQPVRLAVSDDGHTLAASGSASTTFDNTVVMWHLGAAGSVPIRTGSIPVGGDPFPGSDVAFAPHGETLALAAGASGVALWDLAPNSWPRKLCAMLDRDLTPAERSTFLPADQRAQPTCPG